MANDCYRKVSRGHVWFLIDTRPNVQFDGSVQGKNRPWLVISNDKSNQYSPTFTCVPLTTADKPSYIPTHVEFNLGDKPQTILCEQPQTLSVNLFNNSGSHYCYSLSDKLMKEVDEALAIHLGLRLIFPNSDRFWQSLEKLIRVRVKNALDDVKIEGLDIAKVASLIDSQTRSIVKEETSALTTVEPEKPVELPTVEPHAEPVSHEEPKKDWVPHKPVVTRNKWTIPSMKEFVADSDKLSTKEMMEKYNMSMKTVYITKSKFKKVLAGLENEKS